MAKQRLKFFRPARVLAAPWMNWRMKRRDDAYERTPDSAYIASLKDTHCGERCFIVGTGPSLRVEDLEALEGEEVFAPNGIIRLYGQTQWRPTYYLCIDPLFFALRDEPAESVEAGHLFFDVSIEKYVKVKDDRVTYLNWHRLRFDPDKFTTRAIGLSSDPSRFICSGHTVTEAKAIHRVSASTPMFDFFSLG